MSSKQSNSGSSNSGDEDNTWDDWVENDEVPTRSLIRPSTECLSAKAALAHDREQHGFDLLQTSKDLRLDFLGKIRFINWLRAGAEGGRSKEEIDVLTKEPSCLADEAWLLPQLEGDGMLLIDLDDDPEMDSPQAPYHPDPSPNTLSVPPTAATSDLEVSRLGEALRDAQLQLEACRSELMDFRVTASRQFHANLNTVSEARQPFSSETEPTTRDDDTHYFSSYAGNEIHATMLRDSVRTDSYRHFLVSNPSLMKGKRILDIGCGTGILSFFAARAGAAKVYSVDASAVALKAIQHVRDNGLGDAVKVIQRKAEALSLEDLDGLPVDMVVSEWMGYALLYEGFLPSVLHARDAFLVPGGSMAPSQCSMLLSVWGDEKWYKEHVTWWESIYDFDMSAMKEEVFDNAVVDSLSSEGIRASPAAIRDVHTPSLPTDPTQCVNFKTTFELTCNKEGVIHGFILWFDTFFTEDGRLVKSLALEEAGNESKGWKNSEGEVGFSTSPRTKDTHWHQTLFVLKKPIEGVTGTKILGDVSLRVSEENSREIEVDIAWRTAKAGSDDAGDFCAQTWRVT